MLFRSVLVGLHVVVATECKVHLRVMDANAVLGQNARRCFCSVLTADCCLSVASNPRLCRRLQINSTSAALESSSVEVDHTLAPRIAFNFLITEHPHTHIHVLDFPSPSPPPPPDNYLFLRDASTSVSPSSVCLLPDAPFFLAFSPSFLWNDLCDDVAQSFFF